MSTYVINCLQQEGGFTTAYHICDSYTTGKNLLGEILRSITLQLLKSNLDLAPYIFENFANKGLSPSIVRLRRLLPELVGTISDIRIIVDGMDEYPESDQRTIFTELMNLCKLSQCRVLFSNRDGKVIDKQLGGKPTVSLKDQQVDVAKDIEAYVHTSLGDFRKAHGDAFINQLESRIAQKASGKSGQPSSQLIG